MRLFISWSGGRSHRLAAVLKEWLEAHFASQGISVFVSSEIKKGSLWLSAVNDELRRADAGLVCLTPQSLDSEWVLFEAGALSTAVALRTGEARIFTYLLGVDPAALPGPLSVYQSTAATMEDTLRLVNSLLDRNQVDTADFAAVWDKLWPRLQRIENEPVTGIFPGLPGLFDRKTFAEPVQECTDQSWFDRYDGAVATRAALEAQKELVAAECNAQLGDLYRDLVATVDGYAMDVRALLFEPKTFALADDGMLAIPCGVRAALERRREAVHQLVAALIDQRQQPLLPDAVRFARSPAFAVKKSIVHRIERQLDESGDELPDHLTGLWSQLLTSDWELDRITAYLLGKSAPAGKSARGRPKQSGQGARAALAAARRELDLVRAAGQPRLMPLHYSLRWVEATGPFASPQPAADVQELADAVTNVIDAKNLDRGGQVRELLSDLRTLASPDGAGSATPRPG
jgi:TIR domain